MTCFCFDMIPCPFDCSLLYISFSTFTAFLSFLCATCMAYVCMFMWIFWCFDSCVYMEARGILWVFYSTALHLILFKQGHSPILPSWLGWLARELPAFSCLHPQCWSHGHGRSVIPSIFRCAGDSSSGAHCHTANAPAHWDICLPKSYIVYLMHWLCTFWFNSYFLSNASWLLVLCQETLLNPGSIFCSQLEVLTSPHSLAAHG